MRWISTLLLPPVLVCALASGCANLYRSPVRPFAGAPHGGRGAVMGGGFIYSEYKAPLTTDFDATPAEAPRVGRASTAYIMLPLIVVFIDLAFEDASVAKAARNGGITKVHYADHEFVSVLGLYGTYTTTVYGE